MKTECMNCGKKGMEVYRLTAEDIQRKYDPDKWMTILVCAPCREAIRGAARLESAYKARTAAKDFSGIAALTIAIIIGTALLVPNLHIPVFGGAGRVSFLAGVLAILTGLSSLWNRLIDRYAFTHDLGWSVKSRRVVLGLAMIFGGIVSSLIFLL